MKKVRLKDVLNIKLNSDTIYGCVTQYMVWSPVHHYWIYPNEYTWTNLSSKERRFLLKQEVVMLSLRESAKGYIAVFLKDYGVCKNKKIKKKFNQT